MSERKEEADELYVLLKKNYRISRNIRLIWFFDNICKDLNKLPHVLLKNGQLDDSSGQEIQILSVIQKKRVSEGFSTIEEVASDEDGTQDNKEPPECLLQPHTKVYFLARAYRLVFALDLSPSLFRVDASSYKTIAEGVLSRLADCLFSLMQPFRVPGSEIALHPNIYVTIFAQTRPTCRSRERYMQEVIAQGCLLTPQSVLTILQTVECKIYHGMKQWSENSRLKDASHPARHDHGLVSMLRTGLLALQLLPANTSAGIVVITDGVVGMPDMAVLETLLNQLRSTTTSCSFLHIPNSQAAFCDFSFCANTELLQFIASATYGTWFNACDEVNYQTEGINKYQKHLLIWQFQVGKMNERFLVDSDHEESPDVRSWDPDTDLRYTPKQKNMYISPILRKKHFEGTLRVSILAVISVRLREGYMISSVSLNKNQNQMDVQLVFPWNHGASIKYYASSSWPIVRNITKVEVYIEGTYEFLTDVSVGFGQESRSRYRSIVVRRFKHFMKGLSQTDHMLMHLLSFTSDPVHYSLIQNHVPLFYLPPNSNQLVLSSGNESSQSMFATYWKPILSLDVSIWQRWLHTHHIEIILQHDMPLPRHLHLPSKSGRYHSIQTSFAMSQLSSLLRDWSTFVLLENHSYVKFIYKENEEKPSSFYLVRLSNKAPMVVIRLAFLIGTTGPYRNQVLQELRSRVLSLTFPSTNKQPSSLNVRTSGSGVRSRNPSAQTRTRHSSSSERQCAVLIHKPLDRVLIRYDQSPRDFMQPPSAGYRQGKCDATTRSGSSTAGGEVGSSSLVQDLCRYMNHHRWVWSITNRSSTQLSLAVAGQMASLLVKVRLSEGFNFANCSSGVISMVREFPVTLSNDDSHDDDTNYYCLVQFIIFPPTVCTSRESLSMDGSGDEEETTEADGELFLATEMWIEPQCGTVTMPETGVVPLTRTTASRHASGVSDGGRASRFSSVSSSATSTGLPSDSAYQRFLGLKCSEIPQVVANEDNTLLSIMVTIEHLRLMCLPHITVLPSLPQGNAESLPKNLSQEKTQSDEYLYPTSDEHEEVNGLPEHAYKPPSVEITHNPCLFNLVELLDRCTRVKLLFMTLTQDTTCPEGEAFSPNECLFEYFHLSLEKISDREPMLSDADCSSITNHMINRDKENNIVDGHTEARTEEEVGGKWKCYLKILPKAKVLVILLPSTYKDLQNFSDNLPGYVKSKSEPATEVNPKCVDETLTAAQSNVIPELPTGRSPSRGQESSPGPKNLNLEQNLCRDDYRLARRLSIKRMNSQISSKSGGEAEEQQWNLEGMKKEPVPERFGASADGGVQLSLPVFVYECSTQNLVDQMVKDPTSKPAQWLFNDIEQDHRIQSVDNKLDNDVSRSRSTIFFRSQSHPHHTTPIITNNEGFFTSSSEDVFASFPQPRILDPEVSCLCDNLVEAYHRCFVRGVAYSLKVSGGNVAGIDVQAATDAICQESVQEIDITQFLLITCPQVAAFKVKNSISQDLAEQRDMDDVFSLDFNPHIPVARVEPMVRHTSSTSSTTDPALQEQVRVPRKPHTRSPPLTGPQQHKKEIEKLKANHSGEEEEKLMKINIDITEHASSEKGENGQILEEISASKPERDASQASMVTNNAEVKNTMTSDKSSSRSAFKKLRRRPRTPPKTGGLISSQGTDSDGETPDAETPRSTHVGPGKSKVSSVRGPHDSNSLQRSLKVAMPLKKTLPGSRIGWDGLPEFPLSTLKEPHPRHLSGSDDQVKANFQKMLLHNFRSVPSIPDFFYYNSQDLLSSDEEVYNHENTEADASADIEEHENEHPFFENATESDQEVKFEFDDPDEENSTEADARPQSQSGTILSNNSRNNDLSSKKSKKRRSKDRRYMEDLDDKDYFNNVSRKLNSSSSTSDDSSYQEDEEEEDMENFPLFLCMTCTVRDKRTANHGTMPVDSLPTNLHTVLSYLERPCTHVDLSQLCITLDLIWMMLPSDTSDCDQNTPGCDEESTSDEKFYSGLLPDEDDSPQHESAEVKERNNTVHEEQGPSDPLTTLPSSCLTAVNNTKEKIEWLLRDEIICALRSCETITRDTLEKVAKHVEESTGSNCMREVSNLQFVFGIEKSFQHFTEIFEKTFKDFKGYRMRKEEPYYYFTTERVFLPIPNWPSVEFMGTNEAFSNVDHGLEAQYKPLPSQDIENAKIAESEAKNIEGQNVHQGQHMKLRRTKTAPTSIKQQPAVGLATTSSLSLPPNVCLLHTSSSSPALPNAEGIMSVAAIESDVSLPVDGSNASGAAKQPTSSQSTPIRKTSSAMEISSGCVSTSDNKSWSPRFCAQGFQAMKNSKLRRLPNTDESMEHGSGTSPDIGKHKRRGPVKQHSMESNTFTPEHNPQHCMRRSSHSVIPLSSRNSPQQYSNPTSPFVSQHISAHNSSFNSASSAPSMMSRRSSQVVSAMMPGTQSAPLKNNAEPNSSTPVLHNQFVAVHGQGLNTGIFGNKDQSPVSDGEFRRYSTASWFESGYDGEESDLDGDDEYMASLQDGGNDLPSFWLIALVQMDNVKLYFHRRSSTVVQDVVDVENKWIFKTVVDRVHETCKRVNQMLLLLELHDSRMCNALLVEETEEDIWKRDYNPAPYFGQYPDDHGDDTKGVLLAATMTNAPGQFACDCVMENVIKLHPRLKSAGGVPGKSSVMATVRDLVRNFMVTNRKNMFVYSLQDKSVFYCRMEEDSGPVSAKGDSRRSSMLIQSSTSGTENVGSWNDNIVTTPERRSSRESLTGIGLPDVKSGGNLTLRWYGVGLLNPQQQEELDKMNQSIARKLNESVLEKITVLLQRKSKLSAADVLFIQQTTQSSAATSGRSPAACHARPVMPSATLSFSLPDQFSGCIPAVRYYLHQNLLQFMAVPRYTDPVHLAGHFTTYRMKSRPGDEPSPKFPGTPTIYCTGDGSVFLFHQSIEPGKTGYGIACVVLEITDSSGNQLSPDIMLRFNATENPNIEQLLKLTEVIDYNQDDSTSPTPSKLTVSAASSSGTNPPEDTVNKIDPSRAVVRFHLWLKGSLTTDHLRDRLRPAVRHALFDTVTELFVIRSPLCDVHQSVRSNDDDLPPMEFQKTKRLSRFARKLSLPNPSFLSLNSAPPRLHNDDSLSDLFPGISGKTHCKTPTAHSPLSRVRSSPTGKHALSSSTNLLVSPDVITGKTDAMRSLFGSLNDSSSRPGLFNSIRHSRADTREEEQGAKQAGGKKLNTAVKSDRRKSVSAKAEEGELGNLKDIYRELSETWFDSMEGNNVPAVFKIQMELTNARCMTNALPDMQKLFATTLSDCKVRVFISPFGKSKMSPFDCEHVSKDPKRGSKIPGRYPSYVIIARNFLLWRKAVGSYTLATAGQQTISNTTKFPPYDASVRPEQSPRPQEHRLPTPSAAYIPRQQFVLASIQARSVKIWGYNISNETSRNLQNRLRKCIDFHNARLRALHCLTAQKLGLLRHCTFENGYLPQANAKDEENEEKPVQRVVPSPIFLRQYSDSTREQTNAGSQQNSFLKDIKEVDLVLLHSSTPSDRDMQSQPRTKQAKRAFFNEAFFTNKPCKPMHLSKYSKEVDVATQYSKQYMEMKANLKKRGEEQQQLHRVFSNWRERPASISNTSIKKDVLQILLHQARLIHHVSSPILFSPAWRKLYLRLQNKEKQNEDELLLPKEPQLTKRQKRLSGNIRKSGDFTGRSVDESKSRSRSNSTRKESAKDKSAKSSLQLAKMESIEECKYDTEDLRRSLLMHYIQYWQSMHFLLVKEEKNGRSEKTSRKSESEGVKYRKNKSPRKNVDLALQEKTDEPNQKMHLYRVASGGIVVVEISCVSMNFLVKLYILEASRLQYQQNINQQMTVLFLNDCEHLKDYTHVHSFAYDFHLRYVQWYIQDRQTAIKPGYHLVSFLTDFTSYYKIPPLFVFNDLHTGTVEAPCSHVTPDELYEYIVGKQASRHGFKALKLTDNEVERNEHAMVSGRLICSEFHSVSCNKEDHDMYDVCYVISHDSSERRNSLDPGDRKTMKLKFFILFTNRRHLFPRFDLQDNLNPLQMAAKPRVTFPSHMKSNSVIGLSQEDAAVTPTTTASALQKLKAQGYLQESQGSASLETNRMYPQHTRKKMVKASSISRDVMELGVKDYDKNRSPSPTPLDPKNIYSSPGMDKQRLLSQGRRQSLPNFGVMQRSTKSVQLANKSNKLSSDGNKFQNSAGRTIQVAAESQNIGSIQQDSGIPTFLLCEIQRLEEFLLGICKSAEIQCYRNQLWDKVYMDKSSQSKSSSMLTLHDFEHLLQHCQKVPLNKLDPRGTDLSNVEVMGVQWAVSLQKHLLNRFSQICRMFTNAEGTKRYLGVLNPKLYYMMLLITVDTDAEEIGMFAVLRDKQEELEKEQPDLTSGNPSLIPLLGHLNNMIDFMCYHTWVTLVSN